MTIHGMHHSVYSCRDSVPACASGTAHGACLAFFPSARNQALANLDRWTVTRDTQQAH